MLMPSQRPKSISRNSGTSCTAAHGGDQRGALPGAAQGARHHEVEDFLVQRARGRAHLRTTLFGERQVGRSVQALARVSDGLAVADHHDAAQRGHATSG